jgi:hypothetical protein
MAETKRKWFGGALSAAGAVLAISAIILLMHDQRASHLALAAAFAALGGSALAISDRPGWLKTALVILCGFNVVLQGLLFVWQR